MLGVSRLRRQNSDLWFEAHGGRWFWVVQPTESWLVPELAGNRFEDWEGAAPDELLQELAGIRITRFWTSSKDVRFVIKATRLHRFRTRFRSIFRHTHAEKEWMAARKAYHAGLSTPRPVSIGLYHSGGMVQETIIVTDAIPNSASVKQLLDDEERPSKAFRAWLAPAVGRTLTDLWYDGLHHRQLKASNLVVSGWPESPRLWFVDTKHLSILDHQPTEDDIVRFLAYLHELWKPYLLKRKILRADLLYTLRTVALGMQLDNASLLERIQKRLQDDSWVRPRVIR